MLAFLGLVLVIGVVGANVRHNFFEFIIDFTIFSSKQDSAINYIGNGVEATDPPQHACLLLNLQFDIINVGGGTIISARHVVTSASFVAG